MSKHPTSRAPSSSHLTAGAISGFCSCILLQPLDVIKTRLQQPQTDWIKGSIKLPLTPSNLPIPRYLLTRLKSDFLAGIIPIRSISSTIIREQGPIGLWKGTAPTILRNMPGSALYFYLLDQFRYNLRRYPDLISSNTINLVSGATARGIAGLILMPISIIKVRFESNQYQYTSIANGCRDIISKNGMKGLFAGFGVTAARDVPYAGIYVGIYEQIKRHINPEGSIASTFMAGIVAGTLATIVTHPFDLIKTRVQVDPSQLNSVQTAYRLFMSEGTSAFFRGLSPRLLRKPLHAAITWATYEHLIRWIPN